MADHEHDGEEPPGTRFLLYPQAPFLDPSQAPELVEV